MPLRERVLRHAAKLSLMSLAALLGACSNVAELGGERSVGATSVPDAGADSRPSEAGADTKPLDPKVLFADDAESDQPCERHSPALRAAELSTIASCNDATAPLSGARSFRFAEEESVLCDPCWDADPTELWAEAIFRIDAAHETFFLPIQFVDDEYVAIAVKRRTGVFAEISPDHAIALACADNQSRTLTKPLDAGQAYVLTMRYSWIEEFGELWVRRWVDGRPEAPLGTPTIPMKCARSQAAPTGWFGQSFVDPGPGSGVALLDDVRITTAISALRYQ